MSKIIISSIDEDLICLDRVISYDCPIKNVIISLGNVGKEQRTSYLKNYGLSQFIWDMINWFCRR